MKACTITSTLFPFHKICYVSFNLHVSRHHPLKPTIPNNGNKNSLYTKRWNKKHWYYKIIFKMVQRETETME